MKEKSLSWLTLLLTVVLCVGFASCDKDDDDDEENGGKGNSSGITGLWSASNGSYQGVSFRFVYNFINSNTVVDYSTVSNSREGWIGEVVAIPGHSGWYYSPNGMRNYTYYVLDNKIYITDGTILTITDGGLLEDGSNVVYTRW